MTGKSSTQWDTRTGFREGCVIGRRFRATETAIEMVSSTVGFYPQEFDKAAASEHFPGTRVHLKDTSKGKNPRFAALCAMARNREFYICAETCDPEFLQEFLDKARRWRPLPNGENGLRHDDEPDVVSNCADEALLERAPFGDPFEESDEYDGDEMYDEPVQRVKHIRAF